MELLKYYSPDFRFEGSAHVVGNWPAIFGAIGIYLVTIFGLQRIMKNRKKLELNLIVPLHNAFLCALSFAMLVGVTSELLKIFQGNTTDDSMTLFLCDPNKKLVRGKHIFWFYIFFLSKFYELLDTVIIVLKKRPIIFLHVYHHCITVVLTFVMLDYEVAVQWIAIIANVAVHVPMYYYYAMSSLGYNVWWKKYITMLQITQFIIDIGSNTIGFMYHYSGYKCSGPLFAWYFGQSILLSFLILFLAFYKSTYKKPSKEQKEQ